jgi:hypothetical protein
VASAVEFGSFTNWSASMRFSCSMSIPRIENQILVPGICKCSRIWSNNT